MRFLALLALLSLAACDKQRAARTAEGGLPPKRSADALLANVDRRLYRPSSAELKGEARVESADLGDVKFKMVVRMREDSAFWFSLRKFGFEGARWLVTADSVFVLNRLQREKLVRSADDLPEEADLLPIEATVGNLLAAFGGAPIGDWTRADVGRERGYYRFSDDRYAGAELRVDARSGLPSEWRYAGEDGRFGRVVFSDFREVGDSGKRFPYARLLLASDEPGDTTRVLIEFDELEEKPGLGFPMSVPDGYGEMF